MKKSVVPHTLICLCILSKLALCVILFFALQAKAAGVTGYKTNSPLIQSPFDLASGGASLTRASLDGLLFVNPSLAPLGPGFLRWIYFRTAIHVGANPEKLVLKMAKERKIDREEVTKTTDANVSPGADFAAGVITTNISAGAFSTARLDLHGRGNDDLGIPKVETSAAGYVGYATSAGVAIKDIGAVATTFKTIYGAESNLELGAPDLVDQNQATTKARDSLKRGGGFGQDVAFTLQKRTRNLDLRLAGVAEDITTTRIKNLPDWPRTYHLGVGLTFHSKGSAMHCSYDVRDLTKAYGEPTSDRTYLGCKVLLENYFGFGAGRGQGMPSYGLLINAFFVRFELGTYGRKLGTAFGTKPRKYYYVSIAIHIP